MRLPPRLKLVIVISLALAIPSCLCSSWVFLYIEGEDLTCWEAQNLPHFVLETNARFKLPPSAQGIYTVTHSGWSWCTMSVTFKMNSGELNQFASSTQVGSLTAVPMPERFFLDGRENLPQALGLNLQTVKSYLIGYIDSDYFNQQRIFVDTSDPKSYVVYLVTEVGFLD